jgi:hypothetical protein
MNPPTIASSLGQHHAANELDRGDECYFWTGWRRRQWPTMAVAEGAKLYVIDLRLREFSWIARIDRVAVFDYRTWSEFERGLRRGIGVKPVRSDRDVPRPLGGGSACTGFGVRTTIMHRTKIPLPVARVPRLGWLDLSDGALEYDQQELIARAEGARSLRTHLKAERSDALRKDALRYWSSHRGHLRCEACGFDFERVYGARGAGFIEFHHVDPLGGTRKSRRSNPTDLVPLCANCHRIIHRQSPILDVKALRALLKRGRHRP